MTSWPPGVVLRAAVCAAGSGRGLGREGLQHPFQGLDSVIALDHRKAREKLDSCVWGHRRACREEGQDLSSMAIDGGGVGVAVS